MLIYECVNKVNGKVYVGLTTQPFEVRKSAHLRSAKSGSNMHFHKAIRKYGEENFEWYVVMLCGSVESMYKAEQLCISLYEKERLYNKSAGGEHAAYGMRHTDEVKEICKEHALRRWDNRRAEDLYPPEAFLCSTYKEAKALYNVPKTTWYRTKRGKTSAVCQDNG